MVILPSVMSIERYRKFLMRADFEQIDNEDCNSLQQMKRGTYIIFLFLLLDSFRFLATS